MGNNEISGLLKRPKSKIFIEIIFFFIIKEIKHRKEEMKERHCYKCGKILTWTNFMFKNYPHGQEYLESLWEKDYIEFYCCSCFKKQETTFT
ncbi:MAG: hypothetical protein ACFFAT_01325 [Promethearchaeota archaeon]